MVFFLKNLIQYSCISKSKPLKNKAGCIVGVGSENLGMLVLRMSASMIRGVFVRFLIQSLENHSV